MSVLFFVCSQTELDSGLAWVHRICQCEGASAKLIVVGLDRTALIANARRYVSQHQFIDGSDVVDADFDVIVQRIRHQHAKLVVLVSDQDDDEFQSNFFQQCPSAALWIRSHGEPPAAGDQVFCIDQTNQHSVSCFARKWFDLEPGIVLLTPSEFSEAQVSSSDSSLIDAVRETQAKRCDPGDVIAVDCSSSVDARYVKIGTDLIEKSRVASVVLHHDGETMVDGWANRLRDLASRVAEPMDRDQRIELSTALKDGSQPNLEFLGLISASSMLAAFGLLQDSAAVIIGAMLIAPLMTPILGAGLSLSHGNRPLFKTSLATIALGFVGALGASFIFGLLVRWTQEATETSEMLARCQPSPLDFCVGLVGGIAASYARTRRHLSSALAGAAIAAALVPPISTAGLQLAFSGIHESKANNPVWGPLLLVTINVLTIMVGSSFVLYLRGLRSDRTSLHKDRWGLRMFVLLIILGCLVLVNVT